MSIRKSPKSENPPIPTAGETIGDEVALELIRDAKSLTGLTLLRCDGGQRKVGSRHKIGGKTYVPPNIDAKLAERLRLPIGASSYGSTRKLFREVERVFKSFGALNDSQAALATYFAIGTHFCDCAQVAPCLTFTGSEIFQAAQVLRSFQCLVRHALPLSSLGGSLYDVPHRVRPTIVLYQPGRSATVKRLHAASHMRGFPVAREGTIEDLFSPKVMYLGDRSLKGTGAAAAISIVLSPAPRETPVLTDEIEADLSVKFQGQMLQYRIDNYGKVRRSAFDAPQLSGSIRMVARFLGACVPDDPNLQSGIVSLLRGQDAAARAALAMRPESLLIEALLTLCHENKTVVYIGQVASTLNGILENRGENFKVPPRAVGPRVAALGLFTERDASGYAFRLTNEARREIHQLARTQSVPSVLSASAKCPLCAEFSLSLQ